MMSEKLAIGEKSKLMPATESSIRLPIFLDERIAFLSGFLSYALCFAWVLVTGFTSKTNFVVTGCRVGCHDDNLLCSNGVCCHDDVIKWKHFHRSPVNPPAKGQ